MALKDVKQYFLQVQSHLFEMSNILTELNKELAEGKVTEEQVAPIRNEMNKVSENYQRLSYILYLFNKPNRSSKATKYEKKEKLLTNAFEHSTASKEYVIKEDEDALKTFKELVKQLLEKETK